MGYKRIGLDRFQALLEQLKRRIDMNGTIFSDVKVDYYLSAMENNKGRGEIVTFGDGTTVAGKTYYLHSGSSWLETSITVAESGGLGMLATALGTSPSSDGMLVRGFFDYNTQLTGTFAAGATVYLTASGGITTAKPSGSGEILRVLGNCSTTDNVIYFNPSADYLVIE